MFGSSLSMFRAGVSAGAVSVPAPPAWTPTTPAQTLSAQYDPSNIATLFQDTAKTLPVTTDGQTVMVMTEARGLAGFDLVAPSSAAAYVYRATPKPHLEPKGAGSTMKTAAGVQLVNSSTGEHSAVAGIKAPASWTGTVTVFSHDTTSSVPVRVFQLRLNNTNAESIAFSSGGTSKVDTVAGPSASTLTVLSEITQSGFSTEVFNNGVGDGPATLSSALQTGMTGLQIGNGTYVVDFYGGLVYAGPLGTSDHAAAVAWMNGKMS